MSENSPASVLVAGEKALLSDRYVGALFALAQQEQVVDALVADMHSLRTLWNESAEWRSIASNPRLSLELVAAAVEQVSRIAELHKLTANFLSIVGQNRRLNLLPLLIENFLAEVGRSRGEYFASVCTARPLTEKQREKLTTMLGKATGGKISLVMTEDPSLIGGLTVKIGSQYVDASIKTKLERLERVLKGKNAAA